MEAINWVNLVLTSAVASVLATIASVLVAERKMAREYRLHFRAESAVRKLLQHPRWTLRTFRTVKHHVGGFEDDELRKVLVQAGALRFTDANGDEVWGLVERTQ